MPSIQFQIVAPDGFASLKRGRGPGISLPELASELNHDTSFLWQNRMQWTDPLHNQFGSELRKLQTRRFDRGTLSGTRFLNTVASVTAATFRRSAKYPRDASHKRPDNYQGWPIQVGDSRILLALGQRYATCSALSCA